MKITLAKALKVKNRLAGRLSKVQGEIQSYNSVTKGGYQPDIASLYEMAQRLSAGLVVLKSTISRANTGIQEKIYQLAEMKGWISWLGGLDTKAGMYPNHYAEGMMEYIAGVQREQVTDTVTGLENKIDEIQDEIDTYNARTEIEVDGDIMNMAPKVKEVKVKKWHNGTDTYPS